MVDSLHQYLTKGLEREIWEDLKELYIFNESDFQSRVYFRLQGVLNDMSTLRLVLNKPSLTRKSGNIIFPDLVVVNRSGKPEAAIELKFSNGPLPIPDKDIRKLKQLRDKYKTVKKGYFIFVYDDEDNYYFHREEHWMKHYFFDVGINMRRDGNGRRRHGYDSWKRKWDKFRKKWNP